MRGHFLFGIGFRGGSDGVRTSDTDVAWHGSIRLLIGELAETFVDLDPAVLRAKSLSSQHAPPGTAPITPVTSEEQEHAYKCDQCSLSFMTNRALTMHKKKSI